jgi:hypothetical protein
MTHELPHTAEKAFVHSRWVLWTIRLAAIGLFAVGMAIEWSTWPNGSALLGPLGMVWYFGLEPISLLCCALLIPVISAFLLKPSVATAFMSAFGLVIWILMGVVAKGVGC